MGGQRVVVAVSCLLLGVPVPVSAAAWGSPVRCPHLDPLTDAAKPAKQGFLDLDDSLGIRQ